MKNKRSSFLIDFQKNKLIHPEMELTFIRLPERIDDALTFISENFLDEKLFIENKQSENNENKLSENKFIKNNLNDAVFYSEHWSKGRGSSENKSAPEGHETFFSVPFFIEELKKRVPEEMLEFRPNIAFSFNLLEPGAALEDHDHFQSLSDIYEKKSLFNAFIFRPLHAVTPFHLFSLKDYTLEDITETVRMATALQNELVEIENDPHFPSELPKWAQTYRRRKLEILSVEHFENLFTKKIKIDLELAEKSQPEYFKKWTRFSEHLFKIYESEAALRNQNLKEKLFNIHPNLHDSPSFLSISVRVADTFFPGAPFIFQTQDELREFEKLQNSIGKLPALEKTVATDCLEAGALYLDEYEKYLKETRMI